MSGNKPKQSVGSTNFKQEIRERLKTLISTKFATTLAQVPDIINLSMALIYKESSFNPNSVGILYSYDHQRKYLGWSAIASAYSKGTALERANILNGARAYGLMQATGYYALKGAHPSGKPELQRMRPDLVGPLLMAPGTDISSKLVGEDNVENQLLAGLIILEDKYKNVAPGKVADRTFSDIATATFAAYLGLGKKDGLNTTPQGYANSIIRGDAYMMANYGVGPDNRPVSGGGGTVIANGSDPTPGLASGKNLGPVGCG